MRPSQCGQKRFVAYVLSPKVLLGGVLAFAITTAYDIYKEERKESQQEFVSARAEIIKLILPPPEKSEQTSKVIAAVDQLFPLYESSESRDLISKTVGSLYNLRSRQIALEQVADVTNKSDAVAMAKVLEEHKEVATAALESVVHRGSAW